MCMCGKPVVNGQRGYIWNDPSRVGVHPVNPPDLTKTDTLIYDEPGRCGGLDSHSFHFRVVRAQWGGYCLLVRHGGGDERIDLGSRPGVKMWHGMGSNSRYWVLQMLYHVQKYAARDARDAESNKWRKAAAEKRIETRKLPGRGIVRVWIEPEVKG